VEDSFGHKIDLGYKKLLLLNKIIEKNKIIKF